MGMSENGVQTPNEIAMNSRDNDQQNHRGTLFSDKPICFKDIALVLVEYV